MKNFRKLYTNDHLSELTYAIDSALAFHVDINTGNWVAEPNRHTATFVNMCGRLNKESLARHEEMRRELGMIVCLTMITLDLNGYKPPSRSGRSRSSVRRRCRKTNRKT